MSEKTKQFLQKIKDSGNWNDDYDYSKVEYINSTEKVTVIDKRFNTEHSIIPTQILKGVPCSITNLKNGVLSYSEAREFVIGLNLNSIIEWRKFTKDNLIPHNIPLRADAKYKDNGWVSWSDFLGFKSKMGPNKDYLPFDEAREFVIGLGLNSTAEWREYCKTDNKPVNIPFTPNTVYGNSGWISMGDWLGTNRVADRLKEYLPFDVAIDDKVYACDIKNVPIDDSLLDVAVFSLSLMGSNYVDYFKEAYRTLKTYGNVFVCEPAAKWEGREDELKKQLESVGFKCFGTVKNTDKFIYIDGIKY